MKTLLLCFLLLASNGCAILMEAAVDTALEVKCCCGCGRGGCECANKKCN